MTKKYESSAHGRRRGQNGSSTKKGRRNRNSDLRSEYDFASMSGGVRGKYAQRMRESSNIVLLEPDIAKAFPTEDAVNAALRGLLDRGATKRRNP
jgi:hypothetical protein